MIHSSSRLTFVASALKYEEGPPIVQIAVADPSDQCTDRSGGSSINFSLSTPDSPSAVYEFDQFASRFPLPLDHSNSSPVRAERDGKIELLDVPEEIAVFNGEEELSPEFDHTLVEDYRNGKAWINRDLIAWKFECERDVNLSVTSLPIAPAETTIEQGKRNLSVISLPASLPDLSDSPVTTATFAPSPFQDNTFSGSQQAFPIKGSMRLSMHPATDRGFVHLSEGERDSWAECIQDVVLPAQHAPLDLASPLSLPLRTSPVMYSPKSLTDVPEESPSKLDAADSPLFTLSPTATNASTARSSILTSRVVSNATRNLLTYSMSSVVDFQQQLVTSLAATSIVTVGDSEDHAFADPAKSVLGLIHENDGIAEAKRKVQDKSLSASQLSDITRPISFKRRNQPKGLSESDMPWHLPAPDIPPPKGPLPLPGSSPLCRSSEGTPVGYIESREGVAEHAASLKNGTEVRGLCNRSNDRLAPSAAGKDDKDQQDSPEGVSLLTPLQLSGDLLANGLGRPLRDTGWTGGSGNSEFKVGKSADSVHSGSRDRTWDFAWGASSSRERRSIGESSARILFQNTPSPSQYPRSPSSVTASVIERELSVGGRSSAAVGYYPDLRSQYIANSGIVPDKRFLRPYDSSAIPRMASFSSVSTTMSSEGALAFRSGPLHVSSALSASAGKGRLASNAMKGPPHLIVVPQEEANGHCENTCSICGESLDASFRLPGEKAHVIPECGHVLHEACFVAVYGSVPKSLTARRRDMGVCGVCRAPMRVLDEDDVPRSGSGPRGKDKFSALMGLKIDVDKPGNRDVGLVGASRPRNHSSTATSNSPLEANHQQDDEVEPPSPSSIQSDSSILAPIVVPVINVKPEFTTIGLKSEQLPEQMLSCLVTVQVPTSGMRARYDGGSLSSIHNAVEMTTGMKTVLESEQLKPERSHFTQRVFKPSEIMGPSAPEARREAWNDPFSRVMSDLRSRLVDYRGSGVDKLGKIRLFDILKVRKGGVVLDISVYLFQYALVCVTEEKKKNFRNFLNSSPSYTSSRHSSSDEKGHRRDQGVLKLKGRIYFKHVKRVIDTSISGELSLTISMKDENVDSFILAFRDKSSLELWRQTIIEAVQEAKENAALLKGPVYPATSTTTSVPSKLAKMGFAHLAVDAMQDRREVTTPSAKSSSDHSSLQSSVDQEASALPVPLLPRHTPLDLVVVCSVSTLPSSRSSSAMLKLRLIKAALEHVVASLGSHDRLSLVTYEKGRAGPVRKTPFFTMGRVTSRNRIATFLAALGATGSVHERTESDCDNFEVSVNKEIPADMITGINVGLDKLLQRKTKNPVGALILIHDSNEMIKRADMDHVLARAESAATPIHTVGYGKHHNSPNLWLLSSHTHGTYTYIKEWHHLRDCLAGILGGLTSIALNNYKLHLKAEDTVFRCRKVSGAPQATISTDGKYVDISLFELHFGQKVEILLEMDSDKINHGLTAAPPTIPETDVFEKSVKATTVSEEGYIPKISSFTGEIYESASSASHSENLEQISSDSLGDDIPVFELDCTFQDPATGRLIARLSHPMLLTVALDPRNQNSAGELAQRSADLDVARRRYELVASESITRALLLVSRKNWIQADRVLQETSNILETIMTNTIDVVSRQAGTRVGLRREAQANTLIDCLKGILSDIDLLLEGMEESKEAFDRDHRNFGAQQALILRTQRSWTARTHTERRYLVDGAREALLG
ncbi:hypothetical protein NliqN6_4878 [Naganishia liquefaciens]|uniref:RING-type domain-containing protein n=1 Tax=Naganishia liquefaciens TaxID=104408 RepID=A0A8H3TX21_9TREE|nr:hypothetical protein NliqN6_4878 [Naganishia liquefaciens]